jgi:KaiC/GvpD/RAD55 family RecA-like ATPase
MSEEETAAEEKFRTGIPGLDTLLHGGFSKGRVILILGQPGAGKTILSSRFLYSGSTEQNQKGILIGMNEPQRRFIGEMKALGMDFPKLEQEGKFQYLDATEIRRIPETTKIGRIAVGGRELGLVNVLDMIQEAIAKFQPQRIVLDSISDLIFRFPNLEDRRPVILDMIEALQATGATTLITGELLATGEERSVQPEEYLAEGVILMHTLRKGVRTIQIVKMRGQNVDTHPRPFIINDQGIEVYATEEVY